MASDWGGGDPTDAKSAAVQCAVPWVRLVRTQPHKDPAWSISEWQTSPIGGVVGGRRWGDGCVESFPEAWSERWRDKR